MGGVIREHERAESHIACQMRLELERQEQELKQKMALRKTLQTQKRQQAALMREIEHLQEHLLSVKASVTSSFSAAAASNSHSSTLGVPDFANGHSQDRTAPALVEHVECALHLSGLSGAEEFDER